MARRDTSSDGVANQGKEIREGDWMSGGEALFQASCLVGKTETVGETSSREEQK